MSCKILEILPWNVFRSWDFLYFIFIFARSFIIYHIFWKCKCLLILEQKAKLEAKLHQTTSAAAAVASGVGPIHNSVPSNPSSAPGFFIHPSDVIPPTPKTTPLFMTPPLTPPNEAVSAAFSSELAHLFPGSMMESGPVNLAAHKNTQKTKTVSYLCCFHSE